MLLLVKYGGQKVKKTLLQVPHMKNIKRQINKVYIHCSASDNPNHDNIETITQWHLGRGFNTIGYHFFINKNGDIYKGRDLEKIPASQQGHNTGSLAICLSGLNNFTEKQFTSLQKLCLFVNDNMRNITYHGHCEVSNKTCPNFDYKKILNIDEKGFLIKNE